MEINRAYSLSLGYLPASKQRRLILSRREDSGGFPSPPPPPRDELFENIVRARVCNGNALAEL